MKIKIKHLSPTATTPTYGTSGAACFDLYASEDVRGHGHIVVSTGLAFEIPEGYEMVVRPRSGMAFKHGVQAFMGTIDSDYRGEVKVLLTCAPNMYLPVRTGERIAQASIQPVIRAEFEIVDALGDSERGDNGFGSTGE